MEKVQSPFQNRSDFAKEITVATDSNKDEIENTNMTDYPDEDDYDHTVNFGDKLFKNKLLLASKTDKIEESKEGLGDASGDDK